MTLILLVTAGLWSVAQSALYPYGPANGDTLDFTGDDGVAVTFPGPFNFFGNLYSDLYVNINGPISFGQLFFQFLGDSNPIDTPYLAAAWTDVQLDAIYDQNSGHIAYRKVTSGADIARAQTDIGALGYNNPIDYIIVVTWVEVQTFYANDGAPTNLYQTVLAVGLDGSLFAIFNYDHFNWGEDGVATINKGGSTDIFELPFSGAMDTAPAYSNVCVPGRVVIRVDLAVVALTDMGPCPDIFCTSTSGGAVVGYTGASAQMSKVGKNVFTRTNGANTDPCKFLVKAIMDVSGQIMWVAVDVAVHNNPLKHKRSFALNRITGFIQERGQGVKKPQIVTLPYDWDDASTFLTITGDWISGWTVRGLPPCTYAVTYAPHGPEPVLRAVTQDTSVSGGACGALP